MWWHRSKPDDSVDQLRAVFAQMKKLTEAENDGRAAWRISIVRDMLADEFRKPGGRRYRWREDELAHLSGARLETMSEQNAREQSDRS